MTAEEKLALIEGYEPDFTGYIKKETFDKTASELAETKKKLKAKLTEDEQKEIDRAAAEEAIKNELETLRKDKTVSETKAKYLGLGYDEKLATETAKALADGDMDKVFANQALHLENVRKASAAETLADEKTPPAGKGGSTITKEAFEEMGYSDRLQLYNEQPEIYKQFTGGTE